MKPCTQPEPFQFYMLHQIWSQGLVGDASFRIAQLSHPRLPQCDVTEITNIGPIASYIYKWNED
jgi:hypothetical protein